MVRLSGHPPGAGGVGVGCDERKAKGLEARDRAWLSGHPKWAPAADRTDPVALLEEQDTTGSRIWCARSPSGTGRSPGGSHLTI